MQAEYIFYYMVEQVVERVPGDMIKRLAAGRHIRAYNRPLRTGSERLFTMEVLAERRALDVLSRDTQIPLIDECVRLVEERGDVTRGNS